MRAQLRAASLLAAAAFLLGTGTGTAFLPGPALAAAPAQSKIGGTWDLTWKNRRGETRRGSMTVEQRGSELVAHVYDRGGAIATGSIRGSTFTLEGWKLALPFTVTGRVKGGKMTGTLVALGVERRFTGVRRGRR